MSVRVSQCYFTYIYIFFYSAPKSHSAMLNSPYNLAQELVYEIQKDFSNSTVSSRDYHVHTDKLFSFHILIFEK